MNLISVIISTSNKLFVLINNVESTQCRHPLKIRLTLKNWKSGWPKKKKKKKSMSSQTEKPLSLSVTHESQLLVQFMNNLIKFLLKKIYINDNLVPTPVK